MTPAEIQSLFARIGHLKVAVIGDFAVDFYHDLQPDTGEFSLETGLEVHWGRRPRTAPGGAGNVVQNLAALGVAHLAVFGCVGNDLFGREMRALFSGLHVDSRHLLTVPGWDTCTYTKPLRPDGEDHRLDFGTHNALPDAVFADLLAGLEHALPTLDGVVINQQFPSPLLNADRTGALNALVARYPSCRFVADLRDFGRNLRGAVLKVNTAELARLLGTHPADTLDGCVADARLLRAITGGPVVVTRGVQGLVYVDDRETHAVPGLALPGPLDPVGAGDTVVAALMAALAAGAPPLQALDLANRAAAVTVQKLGQTGTASRAEILQLNERRSE